ncbi:MAG: hypothetical protein LBT43_17175 [Prevotella sp.]|nr:hypothetical protein [Prevotella sp.]
MLKLVSNCLKTQAYAMLHVPDVTRWLEGLQQLQKWREPGGRAGIGSVLQNTKCCQVSYSLVYSRVIYNY